MRHQRKVPPGAVPRVCAECGKHFRPMTDRQWKAVRLVHELTSKRHPLMSECHLRRMDADVLNRAAPGHTGSPRYESGIL
jgi:hypothetical protein